MTLTARFATEDYLSLDHLAFFRGYLEGTINLADLGERYLETGSNVSAAQRRLKRIQTLFANTARRAGRHGQARLLLIPRRGLDAAAPASDATSAAARPTFEQFLDEKDPGRDFSEDDMLAMYESEYPAHDPAPLTDGDAPSQANARRREQRNARLFQKRLHLVEDLARTLTSTPRLEHLHAGWFDEPLSNRLAAIQKEPPQTLGALMDFIDFHGSRWYKHVPGLGRTNAERITDWLKDHAESLGRTLSPRAQGAKRTVAAPLAPGEPAATQIANPGLEALITSPGEVVTRTPETVIALLDGSQGRNRAAAEANHLDARNDYEAIESWLATLGNEHTRRSYRREAERLLLWAILERGKPLSGLTTADAAAFRDFMANPEPAHRWVSQKRYDRSHPGWRPYTSDAKGHSGLSRESIKLALNILGILHNWLIGQGYLRFNPFQGLPRFVAKNGMRLEHSLTLAQWRAALDTLHALPPSPTTARLRFILSLAYNTGLRLHEIVQARTGDIHRARLSESYQDTGAGLEMDVLGKGNKTRSVPLNRPVLDALAPYLGLRGLPEDPRQCDPETYLVAHLDAQTPLSASALYKLLKRFFLRVSLSVKDPEDASDLRRASTHWLRHTFGSHALDRGASLGTVREVLGHASIQTTSMYLSTERARIHREAESFGQDAPQP